MKKILILTAVGLTTAKVCFAYTFFNWDPSFTDQVFTNMSALLSDLSPLLVIVIPILLVGLIIGLILSRIGGNR